MTDDSQHSNDPLDPCDLDDADGVTDITMTTPRGKRGTEPYDLSWLFLCFSWEAGFRDWTQGVRTLARALRGLERTGLIERRTIRRAKEPTHHGWVLTDVGREALSALAGHWIDEVAVTESSGPRRSTSNSRSGSRRPTRTRRA